MNICEFCKVYETSKEVAAEFGYKQNYYAVMRERTVVRGREKGTVDNRTVKLIYCPSCGRKLIESEDD